MPSQTKSFTASSPKAKPGASLLERAGKAFGLDPLAKGMPPAPDRLPEQVAPAARKPDRQTTDRPERRRDSGSGGYGVPAEHLALERAALRASAAVNEPAEPAAKADEQKKASQHAKALQCVEFGGPVQAVDRTRLADEGMIVPDAPVSALIEEFRIIKRDVLHSARGRKDPRSRRILIASPHPGEGKTYCAVNLAISMAAERDLEVVLVDADFAKPSVVEVLGLEAKSGLMDCLADPSLAPEKFVVATDIDGLFVLGSGRSTARDAEYLASASTPKILDRLSGNNPNRILVFDTPPLLAASPAAELAKHMGQSLLVARADATGQGALEDARQLLSACPTIKLLLNGALFSPSGRTFGSYSNTEEHE